MLKKLLVSSLLVITASCGADQGSLSSLFSKKELNENSLIIGIGGNQSCGRDARHLESPFGSDIYREIDSLNVKLVSEGQDAADFFVACHMSNKMMAYVDSEDRVIHRDVTEEEVREKLLQKSMTYQAEKNIFVGHSYGGWLLMDMGWQLPVDTQFFKLYTIDPISKKLCSFSTPSGCRSAPQDIDDSMRDMIADNSDEWYQYYQTKTFYLHSSPIEQATENIKIRTSHTSIDNHQAVWSEIFFTATSL